MNRLLQSSKFWALAFGLILLVGVAAFGEGQISDWAGQASVWLALVGPIVYAVMTGLEDALADGVLDLEEVIALVKQVLDELTAE